MRELYEKINCDEMTDVLLLTNTVNGFIRSVLGPSLYFTCTFYWMKSNWESIENIRKY